MKTLYPKVPRNPHSIHRADSFRKLILFLLFVALAIIASANPSVGKVDTRRLELKKAVLNTGGVSERALEFLLQEVTTGNDSRSNRYEL